MKRLRTISRGGWSKRATFWARRDDGSGKWVHASVWEGEPKGLGLSLQGSCHGRFHAPAPEFPLFPLPFPGFFTRFACLTESGETLVRKWTVTVGRRPRWLAWDEHFTIRLQRGLPVYDQVVRYVSRLHTASSLYSWVLL